MKLSIIIVNYKTPQLLLDCLASIYKYPSHHLEVIVVDNDSRDGSEVLLKDKFPEVIFVQAGYNAGFARANNIGIRMAKGEVLLLLNSDTVNLHDAINLCHNHLVHSAYVAAGVQLLNEDLSPQVSGNYTMSGGLNHLLALPYTGKLLKWMAGLANLKKTHVSVARGTIEVDWINGAFLMVKKHAIDNAGLLDEDFFLYYEEAEWCSRLKMQGPLCIFGDLHVIHLQGESAASAYASDSKGYFNLYDKKGLQLMLSCLLRIRKQFGTGWLLLHVLLYLLTIPLFFFASLFKFFTNREKAEISWNNFKGYTKNTFRLMGYIPRIIGGKPYFYKAL